MSWALCPVLRRSRLQPHSWLAFIGRFCRPVLLKQIDLFGAIGFSVAVEEVVLPDVGLAHAGPPAPTEVRLRLAVDQSRCIIS